MSDNMHHQWLLLAACFWVIFMFMVASKFITLTFKDPDAYSAKQEFLFLTAVPDTGRSPGETHLPEELKPTGRMLVEPLVYTQRLELMRNVCREDTLRNLSHTAISKFVLDRIFVCDKHKILFCQTPKVGNTQWKKVLIVLNGGQGSTLTESPGTCPHSCSPVQRRTHSQCPGWGDPCQWVWGSPHPQSTPSYNEQPCSEDLIDLLQEM